jgi:glycosyltransferase involved in cell wall biosynthesis
MIAFAPHGPYGSVLAQQDGQCPSRPGSLDVPAVTVDQLIAERGLVRVDLVKIDIEGSETRAIRGMRRLLSGPEPPLLVVESNSYALGVQGSSPVELLSEIEALGYRLLLVDYDEPGRLVPTRPTDVQPKAVTDYLAVKGQHQIVPPWRVAPFDAADIAGRLIIQTRSKHNAYRTHAARTLRSAGGGLAEIPAAAEALDRLAKDPNVGVRASAGDGNGTIESTRNLRARRRMGQDRARRRFDDAGKPTFSFVASLDSSGGYGYSAEELALAAARQGAQIGWVVLSTIDDRFTAPAVRALEIPRHQHEEYEVMVIYAAPYSWTALRAPITLGMTMFETTELPDSWVPQCEATDGLIVPSEFNREVFSQKLSVPIEVVPLGVNPQHYPELERPEPQIFTFLMAGGLSPRKAPDIAVRAFEQEFRRHEAVRLVLKAYRNTLDWNGYLPTDPRIHVIDGDADRRRMLELYRSADCLVACSRGEASGLTPREAMSTGIPAIVTNWGGLRELANPDCAFVLETEGEEPAFGASFPFGVTGGSPIGRFASPSVDHLAELMRRAYEDRDATRAMGRRAAAWMRAEWTYDRSAQKWLEATTRLVAGKCRTASG